MIKHLLGFCAVASMAISPAVAADLSRFDDPGARRSGAGVGAYVELPFGGPQSGRTQAGLRMTVSHDYRDARAPTAPVHRSDAIDLRLVGRPEATLLVAGRPVTGEEARRKNLIGPLGTVVYLAVAVAAVVGVIVIADAVGDSGDE